MANKPTIAKVLTTIGKLPNDQLKIVALRSQVDPTIFTILKHAVDPAIEWLLPDGDLPQEFWKPSDIDDYSALYADSRLLYLFVKGGHPTLTQLRREQKFIELLQNVAPDDARLLLLIKDKKLPEGLDAALVKQAFPTIF